jgi:hypothetical protein
MRAVGQQALLDTREMPRIGQMFIDISLSRQVQYIKSITAIVRSPSVKRFVVGYTSRGAWKRFGEYRKEACSHLVVLADTLTYSQAANLERSLQDRCWSDERSILYKKYDPVRRVKKGFYGAPTPKNPLDKSKNHVVYLAWWE